VCGVRISAFFTHVAQAVMCSGVVAQHQLWTSCNGLLSLAGSVLCLHAYNSPVLEFSLLVWCWGDVCYVVFCGVCSC
jgi:hypothetical protein